MRANGVSVVVTCPCHFLKVYSVKNDDSKLFRELNTLRVGHRILMTGVSNVGFQVLKLSSFWPRHP